MKNLVGAMLLAGACKTTPPAVPGPKAGAAVQKTVTLEPEHLRYDEAQNTVVFSPGSGVRSAQYTHYILDLESLTAAVGGRPSAPVVVQVEVTGPHTRTEVPEDPYAQQPDGGFVITEWRGKVLGVTE